MSLLAQLPRKCATARPQFAKPTSHPKALQRPLPDDALSIVMRGANKEDRAAAA